MPYTSSSENYAISTRDSPSKWGKKENKNYVYKKSSYQYASSSNNNNNSNSKLNTSYGNKLKTSEQNIDQLDALLEDLKHERQMSTREERELPSDGYRTIEHEHIDPAGTYTKTTRSIQTAAKHSSPRAFADEVDFSNSDYSGTLKSTNYASFQDSLKRDRSYGLATSPTRGHYDSKSRIYESNRALNSTDIMATATAGTTTGHNDDNDPTPDIEKELQSIALTENILPVPGTKVTTTVRTYTYEIPAGAGVTTTTTTNSNSSGGGTINRNQQSNVNAYNAAIKQHETTTTSNITQTQTQPTVPSTVTYNLDSYSALNRQGKEVPIVTNQSYEFREHKETNNIHSNNIHNSSNGNALQTRTVPINAIGPTSMNSTNIYNANHNHNITDSMNTPPLSGATTKRYFYKETSNVVNTIHGPNDVSLPLTGYPPLPPSALAPNYPQPLPGATYSYKYTTSTQNNRRQEQSPSLPPAPFPIDGVEIPVQHASAPQRVDDLMQSFSNSETVDRMEVDGLKRKREIDTSVATPNQQHVPTINKAGKEVYYPPGHELMITKREEMAAAGSSAGGRWAKGSGMYEYEAGEKSKSKSKSGGAMVPVCLPLCCAMPCTIM